MTLHSEHRLLHLAIRAKKPTRQVVNGQTVTATEANKQQQDAYREDSYSRPGMNPNAAYIEKNIQTNYQDPGGWGPNVLTPEEAAANDRAMDLARGGQYVNAPAQGSSPVKNPRASGNQAGAARPAGVMQDNNAADRAARLGLVDTASVPRAPLEKDTEYEARKASIEQQNAAKLAAASSLAEIENRNRRSAGTPVTPGISGPQAGSDPTMTDIPADLQGAYQPGIDAANRQIGRAGEEFAGTYGGLVQDEAAAREDKAAAEESALTAYQDKLKFNDKIEQLQRERTEETQRRLLAENASAEQMAKVDQARSEQLLRDQNVQSELQNRRLAAKLGINHDTGGLQWMHEEVRKGQESLSYLIQRNALTTKDFADQRIDIINGYSLDMRQVDLDAQSRYDSAYDSYLGEKNAIRKDFLAGEKDRKTQLKDARQRYYDQLTEADKSKAQAYQDARLKAWDREFEVEKLEWEKEKYELEKMADSVINPEKTLEWAAKISGNISQRQEVKDFQAVDSHYQNAQTAWNRYNDGDLTAKTFLDNALNRAFFLIQEPNSVVRDSEFALTENLQPFVDKWTNLGWEKAWNGGIGVTDEQRQELVDLMKSWRDNRMDKAMQAAQPDFMQAQFFNSMPGVQQQITPEMLPLMNSADWSQDQMDTFDSLIFSDGAPYDATSVQDLPADGSYANSSMLSGTVHYGSDYWEKGLDISANAGTPITLPFGGTVEKVVDNYTQGFPNDEKKGKAQNGGWGNQVVVKLDNGYRLQVSHLSRTELKALKGQRIDAGTVIGLVGNTGNTYGATGNHADVTIYDESGNPLNAQEVAAMIGVNTVIGKPQMDTIAQQSEKEEPTPQPKAEPGKIYANMGASQGTGSTPLAGGGNQGFGQLAPVAMKKYRNNSTGAIVEAPANKDPYASKPYEFTPIS